MSQENQVTGSTSTQNPPVKRKRGRPRKDESQRHGAEPAVETPRSEQPKRNCRRNTESTSNGVGLLLGKEVTGVLDGSFGAGYLLSVRVRGTDKVLHGVVFDPRLIHPVSEANDVAAGVNMFKRHEMPLNMLSQLHSSAPQVVRKHGEEHPGPPQLKVLSPGRHVSEGTQTSHSLKRHFAPGASKGVPFDINQIPQASPHGLRQSEIIDAGSARILNGGQITRATEVVQPSSPSTDSQKSLNTEMLRKGGILSLSEAALNDVDGAVDSLGPEVSSKTSQGNGTINDVPNAQHQIMGPVQLNKAADAASKGQAVDLNETPVSAGADFAAAGRIQNVGKASEVSGNCSSGSKDFTELNAQLSKMWGYSRQDMTSTSDGRPSNDPMAAGESGSLPQPKSNQP